MIVSENPGSKYALFRSKSFEHIQLKAGMELLLLLLNTTSPNTKNVTANDTEVDGTPVGTLVSLIAVSFYILIALLGVFGNVYVILAVVLSRKLRTFTNIFIVNQSCSDLLSCLCLLSLRG